MRILEARDGFIKLETEKNIFISSFLQINDIAKRYIAQVIQTKRTEDGIIAIAKILFNYDGTLANYDKSLPQKSAEIKEFTFDILGKSIEYTTPVFAGKFIDGSIDIPMDKKCFDRKMLISVDTPSVNNRIVSNLSKQFASLGKVLIIDMLGIIEGQKYVAGVDFKLPLNTESLNFMYEDCLNDATSDSKSLIKEIFNDLSEYSKTVPFLPFDALKSTVDDMVDKQHIFKLLVLRNKLTKFAQQGYFAASIKEAQNLNKIMKEDTVVIDLSRLDTIFQNRYLETIYSFIQGDTQIFIEASNALNKKNIKNIIENESVPAIFITHSRFKYINEIKSLFDNFIIEPSYTNNEVFRIYSTFLNAMPKDTYLLVGEGTNYIPLVSSLETIINIPKGKGFITEEDLAAPTKNEPENIKTIVEEVIEEEAEEPLIVSKTTTEDLIEQKSEDFIDKITEETTASEEISETPDLFDNDEEDEEVIIEKEEEIEETLPIISEEENAKEDILIENLPEEEPQIAEDVPEGEIELEESATEVLTEEGNNETSFTEGFHTETDEIQTIEIPEDISDFADEIEAEELSVPEEIEAPFEESVDTTPEAIRLKEIKEEEEEVKLIEENQPEEIPLEDSEEEVFEEIVEPDESGIDDAILIDIDEEEGLEEELLSEEDLDTQIVQDVDKVFTTIKEDTISDSDLDLIDELNNEAFEEADELIIEEGSIEELPEEFEENEEDDSILAPLQEQEGIVLEEENNDSGEILTTKSSKTPIVPVYDANIPQEDIVISDPIEQGDVVTHAKYGTGTVEKMIKYGTKVLYSINFDNVGRRLLDPTLTEIKKG